MPGGTLAFTAFGPETFRELREALQEGQGPGSTTSSSAFRPAGVYRDELQKLFPVSEVREYVFQETYGSLLDLLHDIRWTGTRGAGAEQGGAWRRETLRAVEEAYRTRSGGITATYQLFVCRAVAS